MDTPQAEEVDEAAALSSKMKAVSIKDKPTSHQPEEVDKAATLSSMMKTVTAKRGRTSPQKGEADKAGTSSSMMKEVTFKGTRTQPGLKAMPAQVIDEIMSFLDVMDSTCLGLTCKSFYKLYKKRHPTIPFPLGTVRMYKCGLDACPQLPPIADHVRRSCYRIVILDTIVDTTALHSAVLRDTNMLYQQCPRDETCGYAMDLLPEEKGIYCVPFRHLKEWMGDGMHFCCQCGLFVVKGHGPACFRCGELDPEVPTAMSMPLLP